VQIHSVDIQKSIQDTVIVMVVGTFMMPAKRDFCQCFQLSMDEGNKGVYYCTSDLLRFTSEVLCSVRHL
jgi:hypothetical protein